MCVDGLVIVFVHIQIHHLKWQSVVHGSFLWQHR